MSALEGLLVVDLSTTLPGALATQFLADAGADVVLVEPPGGSPLRANPGWPSLGRGKRSRVLDLADDAGRAELELLLAAADVAVTTWRPSTARTLGLDGPSLGARHPRLVSAAITGWGPDGPWAEHKGYEALVMAKLGFFQTKHRLAPRRGPAFVSAPFASWGAAQSAVHGILAALLEREDSGAGQHVDADLVRGAHAVDTWAWYTELAGLRWPDAFQVVEAFNDAFEVQAPLVYPLLAAPTSDGHWLQFAQVQPRLFAAFMEELGLMGLFTDPRWAGLPVLPTQELRTELWETMISKVGERTLAEWQQVFDSNPDIFAEQFRAGRGALEHPQLLHDRRVVEVDGVTMPSTLVHVDGAPTTGLRPAPSLDDAGDLPAPPPAAPAPQDAPRTLPLAGLTVLDFGVMFASPYGATLLTDLGARVVKIEPLTGDTIRVVQQFPESGGAKVMQGKESVTLDIATEDGRRIVHQLVARADVVLQSFRAGAAERAGIDPATVRQVNPDIVYVSAPGYGTDGPYGHRPAYAPSIGAASGLALIDAPGALHATGSLAQKKQAGAQLNQASAVIPLQADGVSALGVASTILLGLVARRRGRALGDLTATMLGTTTLALQEHLVSYDGRPESPVVDEQFLGLGPLYRLYRAREGWVCLAAPSASDWTELVAALPDAHLADDTRFTDGAGRRTHGAELAVVLDKTFSTRTAAEWEQQLVPLGVGCVEVHEGAPGVYLQTHPDAVSYTATTTSPVFDEHLRLAPLVSFSRSLTQAQGFVLAGEHNEAVLTELGYTSEQIAVLRERSVTT